jgi:hypothetical protein
LASGAKGRGFEPRIAHYPFHGKELAMADLTNMIDRINSFLAKQGLPAMSGQQTDPESLFTSAMRSIWRDPDKQKRENISFAVIRELKKYFGGKNLEDIFNRTKLELDALESRQTGQTATKTLEEKKKNPAYVPTFDELFGKK